MIVIPFTLMLKILGSIEFIIRSGKNGVRVVRNGDNKIYNDTTSLIL